ncbi:CHAD domain-containing protein [Nocardia neocaledoniensis]|uniref:CHAD domain-containing protein n=1 Tax=Nocardia neocaledoniensis TaxID=236511 RepID=UPI003404D317
MTVETRTDAETVPAREHPKVSQMLARYLHAQRETIMDGQLAAGHDDPDAVVGMVKAARRARCALSAHPTAVRRQSEVRRLIEELRWLGIITEATHELRAQSARLHAAVDVLRPRYVRGPVRDRMDDYFGVRIRPAWVAARDLLASPRFAAVVEDLMAEERLLQTGVVPGIDDPDNTLVLDALLGRVRRRMRRVGSARDEDATDAALHELRKSVRRTRYYVESVRELDPARSDQTVAGLVAVQDLLGEHQDAVVAKHHLIQLTREAENAGESTFTYGLLLQREIDRTAECAAALHGVYWRALRAARVMADIHTQADKSSPRTTP